MYKLYREIDGVPLQTLTFNNASIALRTYHRYCHWLKNKEDVKELIYNDTNFRGFNMEHNINVWLKNVTVS